METLPSVKANSPEEVSDAILVSFDAHWETVLANEPVKAFIRKRLPQNIQPRFVYVYCGAPHSRISAKAEVKSLGEITLKEAIAKAAELKLTKQEILDYCVGRDKIGICHLGRILKAKNPLDLAALRSCLTFHPPQSFLILSKFGKATIDKLGSFR